MTRYRFSSNHLLPYVPLAGFSLCRSFGLIVNSANQAFILPLNFEFGKFKRPRRHRDFP
jgi:hypothetical protein